MPGPLRITAENRKWWTLVAISFSLFVINLDNTVIVVALPVIGSELDMSLTATEWVVNSYTLVYAVLLLFGGKLADLLGRRRILLAGLLIFEAASVACALAGDGAFLIAARSVQGIGAALMLPATLALVTATFPPKEHGMALGIWAGVSALALAIGPLIGGVIVEGVDWRWIFWINVPIGLVGYAMVRAIVAESRDESVGRRLDVPGLLIGGVATFAAVFALTEANRYGWGSATIIGLFALAAVALVGFVILERRTRSPLLDLSVFRDSTFAGANAVGLLLLVALFGMLIYFSIFAQNVLQMGPIEAGATFMPMTILLMLSAPIGGKFADEKGATIPMVVGMLLFAGGIFLLSGLDAGWGFWNALPGLALAGIGFGLTMPASTAAALGRVEPDKTGVASGVLNSFRQLGGALGIALTGAVVAAAVGDLAPGSPAYGEEFMDGTAAAFRILAVIALAGALVSAATIRRAPAAEPQLA